MTETELIQKLTAGLPSDSSVLTGPGDDCAVIELGGQKLLLKTDAIVEDIHFTGDTPPKKIGRKAIARALSDIAAMAGTPTHALVTLGICEKHKPAFVESIFVGLRNIAAEHGVNIVGGETTTLPKLTLSISLLGTCNNPILRIGSHLGDALFVTGELGGSIAGHHLEFIPRIKEAHWLSEHVNIHAMIDLSDGLATDLRHLLDKNLGAEILTTALPVRREARLLAKENPSGKTALLAALTDGEDYELLFTVAAKDAVTLLDNWNLNFPETSLKCIGKITDKPGITLRDDKGARPLTLHGYDHLQQS
jgi:thiamine-monophosphate kinase